LDSKYQGSPYSFEGFAFGGTDNARSNITNASSSGKIDVTSQVDNYNLLKFGGELKLHKLVYETSTTISDGPVYQDPNLRVPALNTSGNNFYKQLPLEAAVYLQDKLELSELIVNAGVRFDYWDPKAPILDNPRAETKPGDGIRLNSGLIDAEKRIQISPRFGIAYPISENGVVHVSYGHFFQLPKFSYIFNNSEFEVELGGLETTMGNANLKPEKTIAYEAGLQQQVGNIFNLDFTLYYKDIRNLLSQEIINTIDKKVYARYTNRDYGNVKGFIISLRHNSSAFVNGSLDYTFQIAKGNASDPNAIFVDFQSNPPQESEKQVLPLAWDQRHTLNAAISIGNPSDWNLGIIGRFSTGQPYTPSNPGSQLTTQFENSGRKPFSYNIDLNIYKMINLAGFNLRIFCKVFNLTDRLNELYVYSSTGTASEPYRTKTQRDLLVQNPNLSIDEIDLRPDFYSEPRRVIIGFSVDF
ncbi:MAG: TonB-dependent receptor, partial [Ignavibacteriaceae bacterium]